VNLSDILNSINHSKINLLTEGLHSEYVPYVINRCLSYFPDTLFHSNRMNARTGLGKSQQYRYYLESLSKKKRFSRWIKPDVDPNLETVMEYYGYSRKQAQSVVSLFPESEIKKMQNSLKKGGSKAAKS